MRTALTAISLIALLAAAAPAAGSDNNVEWGGISHVAFLDRTPRCPLAGQDFALRVQSWTGDLTSVRVRVDDGGATFVSASVVGNRGPYDIWEAEIPAPVGSVIEFVFELNDGTDTDYLGPDGITDALPSSGFEMDFTNLTHAPYGSTPTEGGGAVFKVWSPDRTICHVRGEFNSWDTSDQMTRVGEDFIRHVPAAGDRDMYKYYFQNSVWNTDARARSLNPGNNYNAHIEDPERYVWQVDDFDVPDFEEMVVYQLHVGTFAGLNDPYGSAPMPSKYLNVTQRADHLAELGINVVQLCPITEFPWDYSAGYNPVTQWAPESYYGNPDDVRAMVDALHTRGIAVIHDIVWNHFSHDDNFLWEYDGTQFYFDDPVVETPWGSQADFDTDGVRRWFIESAHMWLGEYRMDGFRMDATEYMNIYPQEAAGWSLMQWLNNQMDRRWIDKINIAEQLPDDSWVTRPTDLGGAGFDSQYYDHFTDRLREEIIAAASGDPQMWVIQDILTGSGTYLSGRYVTNYFELHDEAWPSSGGQRMVKTIDTTAPHDDQWARGRTKLAQGIVLTAPGIPAILQGSEWLEDNDFGTDAGNRIDWSHKTTYSGIFDYYADVIGLRTSTAALRADAAIEVFHVNDSGNVIAFRRTNYSGSDMVVVANFSNTDYANYRIGIPLNEDWVEAVNSQDAKYMGAGTTNPGMITPDATGQDGYSQSLEIALSKMALVILKPEDCAGIDDIDKSEMGLRLHAPYPNPMAGGTRIAFDLPASAGAKIAIHDVTGRLVRVVGSGQYPAGRSEMSWDGTNSRGDRVAAGVYVIRIESGGMEALRKAIVLR